MAETADDTPRRNLTAAAAPALIAAVLAAVGAIVLVGQGLGHRAEPAIPGCILEGADAVGGPISLVDHNNSPVTQADFAGEPMVLYFGFTHCPDVCPTSLYLLAEALAEPNGYDLQTAMVSLDPERDTPALMRAYVGTEGFPPGLIGLTGTAAQVGAAKAAFQVYSSRTAGPDYSVDHSSMIYVLDRQWNTVAIMPTVQRADPNDPRSVLTGAAPGDVAACVARGLERRQG
jgi:protein SCO1/2